MLDNFLAHMAGEDKHALNTIFFEQIDEIFQKGSAIHIDKRLRPIGSERHEARALAAGENHCLFDHE